jgi:hypothetical protein
MSNKKKYKALMLDVDGTLVVSSETAVPSQRVTEAIAKAKDVIHIGVATGRYLSQINHLLDRLSLSGPCIVTSGTQIVDAHSRKIIKEQRIDTVAIMPVIAIAQNLGIPLEVVEGDSKNDLYSEGYPIHNPLGLFTKPIDEFVADIFLEEIKHISTISAHKTSSWAENKVHVTISDLRANKQHGIFEVAKILGIETHEIIGVGDHYNDFPLLMACGLKVAMGNAVEDLKAIADYIAPTVEEDGVADVIEKFIL